MTTLNAVVLAAFGAKDLDLPGLEVSGELQRWLDAYEFAESVSLPGCARPLRYTAGGLGLLATGVGKAQAASATTAMLASPAVDVSDARFVTVGAAGGNPAHVEVGSVAIADAVVDWDRKERDGDGIAPLSFTERDPVWRLDRDLLASAARAARGAELAGTDGDTDPEVVVGPTVCGDEFWHGHEAAEQVARLCQQYGLDGFATTEMEDAGTATALERAGLLDRYVSIRGVTNFDRPAHGDAADGDGAPGGLTAAGFERGLENAFRAGRAVVSALR